MHENISKDKSYLFEQDSLRKEEVMYLFEVDKECTYLSPKHLLVFLLYDLATVSWTQSSTNIVD